MTTRDWYDTYRDWVCDADQYTRDIQNSGGWWSARADTDVWIDTDGITLIVAGVND